MSEKLYTIKQQDDYFIATTDDGEYYVGYYCDGDGYYDSRSELIVDLEHANIKYTFEGVNEDVLQSRMLELNSDKETIIELVTNYNKKCKEYDFEHGLNLTFSNGAEEDADILVESDNAWYPSRKC